MTKFLEGVVSKIVSSSLVLILVLSSPVSVFGQDVSSETPVSNQSTLDSQTQDTAITDTSSADLVSEQSTATEDSVQIAEKEAHKKISDPDVQLSASSGGSESPTTANPTFTSQSIQPKVEKTSGALVENYPIVVPKGRNGLEPNLALTYNSQNLEDGIVGYGWNINIPHIERINRRGTNNLYTDNYFNSSINGELSSTTVFNEYRLKVEEVDSLRYIFGTTTGAGGTWIAYDKKGTKYTFGGTAQAKQDDPNNSSKVYKWMLEEVRDTNNNFIRFEYFKDNGQIYPSKIYYTGYSATDGIFQVEFLRQNRPDILTSYKSVFLTKTNYRINQIQTKVNGTWVRKYDLSFTSGSNTLRSLLQSVTETGQDESGTGSISLPATTFEYTNDSVSFTNFPGGQPPAVNGPFRALSDIEGNGLIDQTISFFNGQSNNTHNYFIRNLNNGNISEHIKNNPAYFSEYWAGQNGGGFSSAEKGVRFFDVNGDGLSDVIKSEYDFINSTNIQVLRLNTGYFSSGNGWEYSWNQSTTTFSTPSFSQSDPNGVSTLGLFGNLNGDGLVDYEMASNFFESGNGAYFGNGNGFDTNTSYFAPKSNLPTHGNLDLLAPRLIDINGDGLDDWLYNNGGNIKVCLNEGLSWAPNCDNGFTISTTTVDSNGKDLSVRFHDINGDGLPDFVRSYDMPTYTYVGDGNTPPPVGSANIVMINTGSGWATSTLTVPVVITQHIVVNGGLYAGGIAFNEMWDWTGDGLAEFSGYKNTSQKPDLLKKITYTTGGNTSVTYQPTTQQITDGYPKHRYLPMMVHVVTSITNNDANGNSETINYTYENGDLYFGGPLDRKFAGFENIIETRADSITKTYFYQGNNTSTTTGEIADDVSKIGKSYREDILSPSTGNLIKRTFYNWETSPKTNDRKFVSLTKTLEQIYDGDTTHRDRATVYSYDTNTGNLIQKINYGEVVGESDGTFSDIGADLSSTTISYSINTNANIYLPSVESTQSQSLAKVRESRLYYDNLPLGSVNVGNQTKNESWLTGGTNASTTKTYNSYGLVTSERDPKSNATNYSYDTHNLYPATTTNPLSQTLARTFDLSSGKVKRTVDPNGRIFENIYDGFDRAVEVKEPDQTNGSNLVTKAEYVYTDNAFPIKVQEKRHLDSSIIADKYTYFDGLGRKIQERTEAESSNTFSVSDYVYGNNGKLLKESLPYFASGSVWSAPTGLSYLFSTYSYDALGRITNIANVAGNTTNVYDDWHLTITDPRGKPKDFYNDAYDNLVSVVEHVGGQNATTNYAYNLNQNLTSITDALGNVRNFTYDGLGRRLTAQDLHATSDGTYGTWTYTYDLAGNLIQKIDPKNQTVNYTYDALNRVLTEDYTGAGGTEITYTYDSCTDGKTRLCSVKLTPVVTSYLYTPTGQIKSESRTINSSDYLTQFEYDRQGNHSKIIYPDNAEIKYSYNSAGLLEKIEKKESGESVFSNVVTNFDYSPIRLPSLIVNANGTETQNTYDPAELYRLKTKLTKLSSCTACGGEEAPEGWPQATVEEEVLADELANDLGSELFSQSVIAGGNASSYERKKSAYILRKKDSTITVGDATKETFSPKAVLSKWGEAFLEVSALPKSEAQFGQSLEATLSDGKISWSDGNETFRFYELPISSDLPEGGYEVDVVLSKKPTSNTVSMKIISEGLEFSYQGPLNKENNPEAKRCTETECFDNKGNVILSRPEHVVGSYAVYFKEGIAGDYSQTRNNNYKTGKAFHIYRPKITDSTGKSVWGELEIKEGQPHGTLTITIPQSFLNTATYPVVVDPTFGYTSVGATLGTITDGIIRLSVTHSAPENGTINTVHFYSGYSGSGTSCLVRPVLYKDSDLSLVAYGGENSYSTPGPGTEEWKTLDITDSSITGGTNYNLGVWVSSQTGGNGCRYRYDTNASYSLKSDTFTYHPTNAPANPAVIDSTLTSRRMSLYGTYTASGGGGGGATTTADILQKNIYTYDENGNITQIVDNGEAGTGKIINYSYDDLNRLTLSSTTQASSTPFSHSFTYSLVGNITNKSDVGSYTYAGTNYANPHAPTTINGTTLTYDNNGNLLSYGTKPYLWNYRNQMTQAGNGTATSTFSYDHEGSRVTKSESGNTTIFPNRYFTSTGTTTTKNIFAGDLLIASVTGGVSGGGNISLTSTSSAVQLGYTSGPTTKNWTHTVSGTNPILVLSASIFQDVAGTGGITSATYNGLSLTKASSTRTGTKSTEMWYLTNPTTGPNTLSVTVTGATDDIKLLASSWSGALQSSPLDTKSSTNGSSGNPSVSLTTLTPNDLVLATLTRHSTTDATTSATPLYKDRTSSILSATSYQLAQSPGLYTDTYTGPENHNWSMIMLAIKPSSGGGGTGSTTTHYIHTDHLGGTNVVTDSNGTVVQALDYYPYGSERISSGQNTTDRHYIGERFDSSTSLSYLNARYYEGSRGQFLSQDPTFLAIGDPARMQSSIGVTQDFVLRDPQVMNSYSYARNNPISMKDPNGNFPAAVIPFLLFGTGALVNVTAQGIEDRVSGNPFAWENYAGAAAGGIAGTASLLSGYGAPAVGAVTSGVEDAATQGLSLATGRQDSYSPAQTLGQTAEGAFFGKYLNPKLAGVTVGSNSFKAVQGQIMTKLSNGTIQSFTPQTGSKMLTNQFVGSLPQSFAAGALGNSSILSSIQSQLSAIQKTLSKLIDSSKKK